MTVQNTGNRKNYVGDGVSTTFFYPYKLITATGLLVYVADVLKTLTTDYSVGTITDNGVSITFTTPPANLASVVLIGNPDQLQQSSLPSTGPFPAKTVETMIDKLTLLVQRVADLIGRSLTLSDSDVTTVSTKLPGWKASNLIGWGPSSDSGLQNVDPATMATIVAFGTANADKFSGNGSQTAFTLSANPGALNNLDVAISGVTQRPGIDYTWNGGTTLTFTAAPATGTNNVLARYMQGLPQAYNPDLASTTDPTKGAGMIGFNPALNYAVGTLGWHTQPYISVTDYMTQAELTDWQTGNPVLDHTAACNRATMATLAFTGNADAPKRRIFMPAGNWNIAGPVYVRKGQQFEGAGMGATRISQNPSATTSIFKMGMGLISGVETPDPGGLAPQIANLHINSASSTAAAIHTGGVAGFRISNLFLTNVGIGIFVTGGDGIIDGCIVDQGLNGIVVGASQNVVISNCLFYLLNYQLTVGDGSCDLQINNCHFEYMQYAGVLFADSATIKNTSISACQFISNSQYATFLGYIHTRATAVDTSINDCKFRNMWGFAISHGTGIGGDFTISNSVFDGNKTVSAYSQSTNAGGVQSINETTRLFNCQFKNLPQGAVVSSGAFAGAVEIVGGSYSGLGTATAVTLSNTAAGHVVSIRGMRGDNVTPLVNAQGSHQVSLKNNVDWLGAAAVASGRTYYKVPFTGNDPLLASVSVQANTNPGGNAAYRKNSRYAVTKSIDFNSGVVDNAAKTQISQDGANFAPVIDFQIDFTSVGGGTQQAHSGTGGYLVLSVPSSYTAVKMSVDFD